MVQVWRRLRGIEGKTASGLALMESDEQTVHEPIIFPQFPINEKHYFDSLACLLNHSWSLDETSTGPGAGITQACP